MNNSLSNKIKTYWISINFPKSTKIFSVFFLFLLLIGLIGALYLIQTQKNIDPRKKATDKLQINLPINITEQSTPPFTVENIELFLERGGRVDWCPGNNLIAYDVLESDGYYDIHIIKPDKTEDRCLTCGNTNLPGKNIGQPAWDPTCRYIVFQAEKNLHPKTISNYSTNPGAGQYNDLWGMNYTTGQVFKLWKIPNNKNYGILHPHFSVDGKKLSWSQMYNSANPFVKGEEFGLWKLMIADVKERKGVLSLKNVQEFQPGDEAFYENHGFSPDSRKLIFSSNFQKGKPVLTNTNIYTLDIKSSSVNQLTNEGYNEHAIYSPAGNKIIWMTSKGNNRGTDYWVMNPDGSNKQRLTYFNQPNHPDYMGKNITVADFSWSPDSQKIVGYYHDTATPSSYFTGKKVNEKNILINFEYKPIITTRLLIDNALRGEYSPDGNKILFFRKELGKTYAIYTSDANGNNIECLTCSLPQFDGLDVGGGSWHPSMKYITFHAEKPNHIVHLGSEALTHPGIGWYSDIYIMRLSDKKLLKVTDLPTKTRLFDSKPYTAVLHPHFSTDGKKISWGQSPDMTIRGWFGWELALADFYFDENTFELMNTTIHKPNNINGYYESDDFSSDGSKLLISGNLEPNQSVLSMDVYEYNLIDKSLKRLTQSTDWDESPIYSADNSKIAWLSSNGFKFTDANKLWWEYGKTEFWIMKSDGSSKEQITFFNKPGTDDYLLVNKRRSLAHYIEWHPSGTKLLGSVSLNNSPKPGFEDKLFLIEIE
ncbi:hypothetical protein KKD61_03710 [Patescibacteria group bacterium]|nr:hypothetical protein [Patescibacteria group bacterium]